MIPDPSLGIQAGFDGDQFRTAIRFAMQMGKPNLEGRAVVFIRKGEGMRYFLNDVEVFTTGSTPILIDRDGQPLNPEIEIRRPADEEIEVDVAIETTPVSADETPVGSFKPLRAEVTLLDVDYAKVGDCREMRYNGDRYEYYQEPDTYGLFGVDIHPIIFFAVDES